MELKRQAQPLHKEAAPIGGDPRASGDNFRVPTGRGVLSAAEIEALLRPDIPKDAFEDAKSVEARPIFDFEVGGDGPLLKAEAATLAAEMTVALRQHCSIDAVLGLKSAAYSPLSQIVSRHDRPCVLILFRDRAGLQNAGLTLDADLASALVSVSCGGEPKPEGTQSRPFSALDRAILEQMLAPLAEAIDPSFRIVCVEADRSAAFAMLPPGKAMLADMSCQLGSVQGRMIFARVQEATVSSDPDARATPVSAIVTARIARVSVPISRLSDLKPGTVFRLGLPADQPVELLSGGRDGQLIAEGEIGRKGAHIAVRISKCSPALKG